MLCMRRVTFKLADAFIHVDVALGDVANDWEETARGYLGDYGARAAPQCIVMGSAPVEVIEDTEI